MVVYFGMSNRLPNLNYYDSSGQDWGFTKPYSEETARMIDQEVQVIINEQYERAKSILKEQCVRPQYAGSGIAGTGSNLHGRCRTDLRQACLGFPLGGDSGAARESKR